MAKHRIIDVSRHDRQRGMEKIRRYLEIPEDPQGVGLLVRPPHWLDFALPSWPAFRPAITVAYEWYIMRKLKEDIVAPFYEK